MVPLLSIQPISPPIKCIIIIRFRFYTLSIVEAYLNN